MSFLECVYTKYFTLSPEKDPVRLYLKFVLNWIIIMRLDKIFSNKMVFAVDGRFSLCCALSTETRESVKKRGGKLRTDIIF